MAMEWVFAVVLVCAFVALTVAFNRPVRPLKPSRVIRWDAPAGR